MTAFDRVTATGKIGSHKVRWPVYVAPIQDLVFIGFDLLDKTISGLAGELMQEF
jgi:hypothetical protein